jgi:hypothetical protein
MSETSSDASNVPWQRVDVAAGVSVELPAGRVTRGEYQGVAYAWQPGPAGRLGVWVGAGQGLASWRATFQAVPHLGAATDTTVCGRPATRQEATFDAGPYAVGASLDPDGKVVHEATDHPAMTEVALAFTAADGTPCVATWQVETGQRASHEADAARFFAALTCR